MLSSRRRWVPGLAILAVALLAVAVVALLLWGWGGGEKLRVTATILAEKGGSITSADGKLTLEIPPNALAKDTEIRVQPVRVDQLPAPLRDLAGSSAYRLEPDGLEFSSPVRVQLKLGPDERQPPAGVIAHLLITQGPTGEPEFLDEVETRIALADGSVVVSGQMRHFTWLTETEHYLEVKLEQVEPREQPLGLMFMARAEVSALEDPGSPDRVIRFADFHSVLSAFGSVELQSIDSIFDFPPMERERMEELLWDAPAEGAYRLEMNNRGSFFGGGLFQYMRQLPYGRFLDFRRLKGAGYLRCIQTGLGGYSLTVRATAYDSNVGQSIRVGISVDAVVNCLVALVPPRIRFETPTGIMLPPTTTPTETATPTPPATATPAPVKVGCLMRTELFLDGIDLLPGQEHQGRVRVVVRDRQGVPVAGARVFIRTEKSDGTRTTAEGVTNANGYVVFGMRTTQPGTNTLFITNVEKAGCSWEVFNTSLTWEATAPSAPPALRLSCDHRLPGKESDVIVRGENFSPGQTVSGQVSGPGVVGDGRFSATVGANGRFEARVPINRFGTYNVTVGSLSSTVNVGATCPG